MARKTTEIPKDIEKKAEEIKQLAIENEQCIHHIRELEKQLKELHQKRERIHGKLTLLMGGGSEAVSHKTSQAIPHGRIVTTMAEVMDENNPMTRAEIEKAVKKKMPDVSPNSIRSYLTNLSCFEAIKKGDIRYDKKGWICHK